jgi:pathogenesis-related protein 1
MLLANRLFVISMMPTIGVAAASSAHAVTALDKAGQEEMVSAHNKWRREVSVPALRWSDALGDAAQRWADHLRGSTGCVPRHSKTSNLGENLYWASAVRWSDGRAEPQRIGPTDVVESWGRERRFYDDKSGRCQPGKVCGHYTQVVWRDSTEVGCGMAVCGDASQVWVCNYRPPGNYVGSKPY